MRYRLVIEALTPIAHGDVRTGVDNATNKRLFMRQPTIANGRLAYTPHVSENALRTALLRRPLADHLLRTLDVREGQVPRSVLALLYSGGAMGSGRAPGDETVLGHAVKRSYPMFDLLGGAVDSFIIPRSRLRLSAWLVAEEYMTAISALFPELAGEAATRSAHDLIGDEVRTRGTAERAGNQMLYGYEVLGSGAKIAIELSLDPWSPPVTISAIGRALAEWDGYIGGQGRQGRGRCHIKPLDTTPSPEAYDAYLAAETEMLRAGLLDGSLGTGKTLCAA